MIGAGGRFNFGDGLDNVDAQPFPALYLGANRAVAYREAFALAPNEKTVLTPEEFAALPNKSHSVVFVNGWVDNVLDLTRKERLQDFVNVTKTYKISDSVKDLARKAGVPNRSLVRDTDGLMNALYEVDWRGWADATGASGQLPDVWQARLGSGLRWHLVPVHERRRAMSGGLSAESSQQRITTVAVRNTATRNDGAT